MNRFLESFGFTRINNTEWRKQVGTINLVVIKESVGDTEFVYVRHGAQDVTYWQQRTAGMVIDKLGSAIRNAEQQQRRAQ